MPSAHLWGRPDGDAPRDPRSTLTPSPPNLCLCPLHPQPFADGPVDLLPGTVDPPGSEVVIDGEPSREVVGKQAPLLATAHQDVKDGVQDLTKIVDPGASISCGGWQMRLDVVPFDIGKIRWVRFSHAC